MLPGLTVQTVTVRPRPDTGLSHPQTVAIRQPTFTNRVPQSCRDRIRPARSSLSPAKGRRGMGATGLPLRQSRRLPNRKPASACLPCGPCPVRPQPESRQRAGSGRTQPAPPATRQRSCHPDVPVTGCAVFRRCWLLRRSAPPCRGSGWIRDSGGPPPLQPAETSGPPWPGHRRPRWPESPCPAPGRPGVPW